MHDKPSHHTSKNYEAYSQSRSYSGRDYKSHSERRYNTSSSMPKREDRHHSKGSVSSHRRGHYSSPRGSYSAERLPSINSTRGTQNNNKKRPYVDQSTKISNKKQKINITRTDCGRILLEGYCSAAKLDSICSHPLDWHEIELWVRLWSILYKRVDLRNPTVNKIFVHVLHNIDTHFLNNSFPGPSDLTVWAKNSTDIYLFRKELISKLRFLLEKIKVKFSLEGIIKYLGQYQVITDKNAPQDARSDTHIIINYDEYIRLIDRNINDIFYLKEIVVFDKYEHKNFYIIEEHLNLIMLAKKPVFYGKLMAITCGLIRPQLFSDYLTLNTLDKIIDHISDIELAGNRYGNLLENNQKNNDTDYYSPLGFMIDFMNFIGVIIDKKIIESECRGKKVSDSTKDKIQNLIYRALLNEKVLSEIPYYRIIYLVRSIYHLGYLAKSYLKDPIPSEILLNFIKNIKNGRSDNKSTEPVARLKSSTLTGYNAACLLHGISRLLHHDKITGKMDNETVETLLIESMKYIKSDEPRLFHKAVPSMSYFLTTVHEILVKNALSAPLSNKIVFNVVRDYVNYRLTHRQLAIGFASFYKLLLHCKELRTVEFLMNYSDHCRALIKNEISLENLLFLVRPLVKALEEGHNDEVAELMRQLLRDAPMKKTVALSVKTKKELLSLDKFLLAKGYISIIHYLKLNASVIDDFDELLPDADVPIDTEKYYYTMIEEISNIGVAGFHDKDEDLFSENHGEKTSSSDKNTSPSGSEDDWVADDNSRSEFISANAVDNCPQECAALPSESALELENTTSEDDNVTIYDIIDENALPNSLRSQEKANIATNDHSDGEFSDSVSVYDIIDGLEPGYCHLASDDATTKPHMHAESAAKGLSFPKHEDETNSLSLLANAAMVDSGHLSSNENRNSLRVEESEQGVANNSPSSSDNTVNPLLALNINAFHPLFYRKDCLPDLDVDFPQSRMLARKDQPQQKMQNKSVKLPRKPQKIMDIVNNEQQLLARLNMTAEQINKILASLENERLRSWYQNNPEGSVYNKICDDRLNGLSAEIGAFFRNLDSTQKEFIQNLSHRCLVALLFVCKGHTFYRQVQNDYFRTLLCYLKMEELVIVFKFIDTTMQVYRDHRATLKIIDALIERYNNEEKSAHKKNLLALILTLFTSSIGFHQDNHIHVSAKLLCELWAFLGVSHNDKRSKLIINEKFKRCLHKEHYHLLRSVILAHLDLDFLPTHHKAELTKLAWLAKKAPATNKRKQPDSIEITRNSNEENSNKLSSQENTAPLNELSSTSAENNNPPSPSQMAQINPSYKYTEEDICCTLAAIIHEQQLAQPSPNVIKVLAAAQLNAGMQGNTIADVLENYLQYPQNHFPKQTVLIPVQISDHWLGVKFELQQTSGRTVVTKLTYFNSIKDETADTVYKKRIHDNLLAAGLITPAYPINNHIPIYRQPLGDVVNCGPYLIEMFYGAISGNYWQPCNERTQEIAVNADLNKKMRLRHLQVLQRNNPLQFASYLRAQSEDHPNMVSVQEQWQRTLQREQNQQTISQARTQSLAQGSSKFLLFAPRGNNDVRTAANRSQALR